MGAAVIRRGRGLIGNQEFRKQPKMFWAYVRTLSQHIGYAASGKIKVPSVAQMQAALVDLGLDPNRVGSIKGQTTPLGMTLAGYFQYRAKVLNEFVETQLMTGDEAAELYGEMQAKCKYDCPIPMNKQKGEKAKPAYLRHREYDARAGDQRQTMQLLHPWN